MGADLFICTQKSETSLDYIESIEPEEWTQSEVRQWLKYSNNGIFKSLIKPFKKNKISGLTFIHLTNDDLKHKLGIKQIGLRDSFIFCRDHLITTYNKNQQLKKQLMKKQMINTTINTNKINHENTNMHMSAVNIDECIEIPSHSPYSPYSPYSPTYLNTLTLPDSPFSSIETVNESVIEQSVFGKQIDKCIAENGQHINLCAKEEYDICYIIVNGFCRKYMQINSYNDEINSLCFDFYFEYKEEYMNEFAEDLWKTLANINTKTFLCSNYGDGTIRGFTGYNLIKHIRENELIEYNDNNIIQSCNSLVEYNYIRLVAIISNNGLNVQIPKQNLENRLNEFKWSIEDINNENINSIQYLYQFENDKHREFVKISEPDRMAWYKGCLVQIYSETLCGWYIGKIIDIIQDLITIEYKNKVSGSLMMKTVDRYQNNILKSTKQFTYDRNYQWKINSELMVYCNQNNKWYKGKIINIFNDNILKIYYKNEYDTEFTKHVNKWSIDLRSIKEFYTVGMYVMMWSNSNNIWMKGEIINIKHKYKIPYNTLILVKYGKHFEKWVEWNSNELRSYDANVIRLQLLEFYKRK